MCQRLYKMQLHQALRRENGQDLILLDIKRSHFLELECTPTSELGSVLKKYLEDKEDFVYGND